MECIDCGNCKEGANVYYCPSKGEFCLAVKEGDVKVKSRSGWKKGDPDYEERRKKNRKEKAAASV